MSHILISDQTEDAFFVLNNLTAFNYVSTKTGSPTAKPLADDPARKAIMVRGDSGENLGGLVFFLRGPDEIYVSWFWLSETIRGQGFGMKIMDALKEEAVRLKCKKVTLYTTTHQAPGFYQKAGFRLTRQEPTPSYPAFTDYYFEWLPGTMPTAESGNED